MPQPNIDTDQIIPARYLKVTKKSGLGEGLFYDWRHNKDGSLNTEFILNRPEYDGAEFLVTGDNFGCGSSREHAPWALIDWGFRAVISTSFADIFRNNAMKNGLLPVTVDEGTLNQIFSMFEEDPNVELTIDLSDQILLLPDGRRVHFPIDSFNKMCLLEGIDQLGYLLNHDSNIKTYEESKVHYR